MEFQFSFKHMASSEALQSYAEGKLREKIERFVTKPVEARVTFSVDKHEHKTHCNVIGGDGFNIQVEHVGSDMYGCVDSIADKLVTQLKRQKEKLKTHKVKRGTRGRGGAENGQLEFENEVVDAADILKYEQARRKASGS